MTATTINARVIVSRDSWGKLTKIRLDVDLSDWVKIPAREALSYNLELRWPGVPRAIARITTFSAGNIEIDEPRGMAADELPSEVEIVAVLRSNGRRDPVG